MPADQEIVDLCIHDVQLRRPTARTAGGKPTLADAVTLKGYEEPDEDTARHSLGGTQRTTESVVILIPNETSLPGGPKRNDWIFLAGLDATNLENGRVIKKVGTFFDPEAGDVDHYEVIVGGA